MSAPLNSHLNQLTWYLNKQSRGDRGTAQEQKGEDGLRGEGIVLFLTSDPLAVVGFLRGTGLIIKIKLVQSIGKSQKHQAVDKKELKDV